jgi:hypothetical protein
MRGRKGRFEDLVERQLDLFFQENGELFDEAQEALDAYNTAPKDEAEERYGDYQLVVEAGEDALLDLREAYAATLPEETDDEYRETFNDLARRRIPTFALDLDA